jgi:hypothetical protein
VARSFVGPRWPHSLRWLTRQLDPSLNVRSVFDDDAGGIDVANKLCTLADMCLVRGFYLAFYRAKDFNLSDLDVSPNFPVRDNRRWLVAKLHILEGFRLISEPF